MGLRQLVLKKVFEPKALRIEKAAYDPRPAQEQALRNLQATLSKSVISKQLGFSGLSPDEMRHLRITQYGDYKELFQNAFIGKTSSGSRADKIKFAAQTSGTTGAAKRIPISQNYIQGYQHFSMGMNACYFRASGRWDLIGKTKIVSLTARPDIGETVGDGYQVGFISGLMTQTLPWIFKKRVMLPSEKIQRIAEWNQKIEQAADEALKYRNVGAVAGVPPLVHKFLQHVLDKTGARAIRDIWPDFTSLVTGAVTLTRTQKSDFSEMVGAGPDELFFMETYMATEGQFGHSFFKDWPGLVFNPFENFYQFQEDGKGSLLHLHELEAGKRYVILITTPGGLINYFIKDWIQVTSVKPLTFKVLKRDQEEISFASEKIIPSDLERAIEEASSKMGRRIRDYVVWPDERFPHQLQVALPASVGLMAERAIADFEREFDESLQGINSVYKEVRLDNLIYQRPRVHLLPDQIFSKYTEANLGRGQHKPKKMCLSESEFRSHYGVGPEVQV